MQLWLTSGNRNSWEHFTHAAIALGALILFAATIALVIYPPFLRMPLWVDRLAGIIALRLVPQDFAYVMTVLASLIAAVCTGFCAILLGGREAVTGHRGGFLKLVGEPLHNLGHITALVVSLFSSIAATFGFAATYSIPKAASGQMPPIAAQYALAMSFLQLAISTGIVGITLIPIVNNRKEVFVLPLVMSISIIFWLPLCWLFVFLLAMPTVFSSVVPMFAFIMGAPMAQALFPHGVAKLAGTDRYKALLWQLAAWGFAGLALCVLGIGACIMFVMLLPSIPPWYYAATIRMSLFMLGAALLVYSIYIEGIRKLDKNEALGATGVETRELR